MTSKADIKKMADLIFVGLATPPPNFDSSASELPWGTKRPQVSSIQRKLNRWHEETENLPKEMEWIPFIYNLLKQKPFDDDLDRKWAELIRLTGRKDFRSRKPEKPKSHVSELGRGPLRPLDALSHHSEPADTAVPQLDRRLEPYLERLIAKFRLLPLHGVDETPLEIELERVYVALRAERDDDASLGVRQRLHSAEVEDIARKPLDTISPETLSEIDAEVVRAGFRPDQDSVDDDVHSVGQLFRDIRKLVILGGPGTGKSILGQWIALQCARHLLEEMRSGTPARVKVPRDHVDFEPVQSAVADELVDLGPARLPIFLSVSHYARELARLQDAREPPMSLLRYLGRDPDTLGLADNLTADQLNATFQQLVAGQRAVVILDGLDELADANRRAVVREVHEFIRLCIAADGPAPHVSGGNQILITSRNVGYELAPVQAGCAHFRIEPMLRSAVERFARSWGVAVNAELTLKGRPLFDAEGLLAEIYDGGDGIRVRDLARNPLLVTLMAIVFYLDRHLPEQRAGLYHRLTENLLSIWLRRPECWAHKLQPAELHAALQPLAASLQQSSAANALIGTQRIWEIMSPPLAHMRRQDPHDPRFLALRDTLLSTIQKQVGLLAEQSAGIYTFFHASFREFLAARHLLANPQEAATRIREHLDDPLWREPLLLALEFLTIDGAGWGPEARTQLLTDILAADHEGILIPRAGMTLVAALPGMPGISPTIIEHTVERLLASYGRCIESGSSQRLQIDILQAFRRLRSSSYADLVDRALLSGLRTRESAATVAVLLGSLNWLGPTIVEAMLDALPHDRPELDWPIRQMLARAIVETGDADHPAAPPLADRIARRLPMRQRIVSDPFLKQWIEKDNDWLWLIIALYGGVRFQPETVEEQAVGAGLAGDSADDFRMGQPTFDPRTIVSDLLHTPLATLIGRALSERRAARSLLPALDEMWSRDDPHCQGEVLVAMAALGRDIVPILRTSLGTQDRGRRVALAIERFAWINRSLRPLLCHGGGLAMLTLPIEASERETLHLLGAAAEVLLAAGASPRLLARAIAASPVTPTDPVTHKMLNAEQWAFALSGNVEADGVETASLMPSKGKEAVDAWENLSRTSAFRAGCLGKWSLPIPVPGQEGFRDHYIAMLDTMWTMPRGKHGFLAGRALGSCLNDICDDAELYFETASLLIRCEDDFRAGFRFAAGDVRITDLAIASIRQTVPPAIADLIVTFKAERFRTGGAFAAIAKEAMEADWDVYGAEILFWIAPEELAEMGASGRDELLEQAAKVVFVDPLDDGSLSAEHRFASSIRSATGTIFDRRALVGSKRIMAATAALATGGNHQAIMVSSELPADDYARLLLALAYGEHGGRRESLLAAGLSLIREVADEEARSQLIREARLFWQYDVEVVRQLDAAASEIGESWSRSLAMERVSRMIETHRTAFEARPLVWRVNGKAGGKITFRAAGTSGGLVWGAIYLSAVAREVGALRNIRASAEAAWLVLSDPRADKANALKSAEALASTGSLHGIRLGVREAMILEQLIQQGRADIVQDLWPLFEADGAADAIVKRWADGDGPARSWARLSLAEAGTRDPVVVGTTLDLLEAPADRLRLRAALALHGYGIGYPAHQRWSLRREGPEALDIVARRACDPHATQAVRSTLSWVSKTVNHDDAEAMSRWIAEAGNSAGHVHAQWILRYLDYAEDHVLTRMLEALRGGNAALRTNLLQGVSRAMHRREKSWRDDLSWLAVIPAGIRRAAGHMKGGAAQAVRACIRSELFEQAPDRLDAARAVYDSEFQWLDDETLSAPDKISARLSAIGAASYVYLERYWSDAENAAADIKKPQEALAFLLTWLNAERATTPDPVLISNLLTAVETVARTIKREAVWLLIDPVHWEPILADWAEFLPHWTGRMAAIQLLGRLRLVTDRLIPALSSAIRDIDYVQRAAHEAAKRFRKVEGDILPAVMCLLDSPSASVAASAARFLVAISQGDGEFVDRRQIFRDLQMTAARGNVQAVYLQDDATRGPMGFSSEGRLDRILYDAALAVGNF